MIYFFYLFFRIAFVFVFMASLTEFKYNALKTYTFTISFNLVLWLLCCIVYQFKGSAFLDRIFIFIVTVPAYFCFLFVSKHKGFKFLFSYMTVCNFGLLKSYIGALALNFSGRVEIRLIAETICFVLTLLLLFYVYRKPFLTVLNELDKGWRLLCYIPIMLSLVFLLLFINNTFTTQYIATVFGVFVLMIAYYVVFYYNFKNIMHYFELEKEIKAVTMQTELQKKEYETIMEKINQNKIYVHDQKHHINMLNSLLSDQNIGEAQKYLRKIEAGLNSTVIEHYCDNYVLNVFLSTYLNKAREERISVNCKTDIPEHLNIDNMELGLIFTNAIENAVNACKKIENPDKRRITVVCQERSGQLYIQISNPYDGEVTFDGEFPVSDNKEPGHGIGTRSIASIAKKYGGVFSFTAENGIFKTTAILNV